MNRGKRMIQDGARVTNATITAIPASAQLRPLGNSLIVEPLDWEPSKILNVVYMGHPLRGVVRAAGPGKHPTRYNGRKGARTRSWESKVFVPTTVKVGDVVELGGLEIR
ncbi:MAG TPA: hypothetical protein VH724_15415, partial [Candidatus Angelobacter sp.]|nr:hypothetical protein [Candidatus Angelobacter sp.]